MQQLHRNIITKLERDVTSLQSVSDKDFFLRIQRLMEWFVTNPDLQGLLQKIEEEGNRESEEYRKREDDLKNQLTDAIKEFRKLRRENEKIKTNEEVYEHLKAAKQTLIAEDLYNLPYREGLHQVIQQIFERLNELGIPIDEVIKKAFSEEWETYITDWDKDRISIERFDEYIDPIITFIKKKMEKNEKAKNDCLLNDLYEDLDAYYPKNLIRGSDFGFTLGNLEEVVDLLKKMQIEVDVKLIDILEKKREDFIRHKEVFLERNRVSSWGVFNELRLTLLIHSDWSKADHMITYAAQHLVGRMELVIGGKAELEAREREEYMEYLYTLIRFVKDYFEEVAEKPIPGKMRGLRDLLKGELRLQIDELWRKAREYYASQTGDNILNMTHCRAVESNIHKLITYNKKKELKQLDIFLLSAAACLHDIGISVDDKAEREGNYEKRSKQIISREYKELCLNRGQAIAVADIISAQNLDELDKSSKKIKAIGNEEVNIVELAAIFRLADMLDMTFLRVPDILNKIVYPDGSIPQKWSGRQSITGWHLNEKNRIIIQASPRKDEIDAVYTFWAIMKEELQKIAFFLELYGYPYELELDIGEIFLESESMKDFEEFIKSLYKGISLKQLMDRYMESLLAAAPHIRNYFLNTFPLLDHPFKMKVLSRIFLLSKEFEDQIKGFHYSDIEKITEIIRTLERQARLYELEKLPYQIFYPHQLDEINAVLKFSPDNIEYMEKDVEKIKFDKHAILVGKTGAGKTTSLMRILERSKLDLIVVIKDSIKTIGVEKLYDIGYLGECTIIWDDIQNSIDEFLEALPILKEFRDITFVGTIRSVYYKELERNGYFREFPFIIIYLEGLYVEEVEKLEKQARSLIAAQNYLEARFILQQIIELVPEREQLLQNEFGFLYDFTTSPEEDDKRWKEDKELTEWRKNLWILLSDANNFPLEVMEKLQKDNEVEAFDEESSSDESTEINVLELESWKKGELLEEAVLELFRKYFIIAEEDEDTILQKLRQQKKGTQFGHDISFECTVKGNENVKCHVECKNKRNVISLRDIADKLLSTKTYCSDIDHWILISPHSNPSSELDNLLSSWHEKREYPFEIQIWCPETGVEEFFGLNPAIYELFYKSKEGETHPSKWTEEKHQNVFEKWKEKLKPVSRLPEEWEEYIREPSLMFIKGDRTTVLKSLYEHYVPMRCMDERRNIIGQTLGQYILEWLKDTNTPVMFLLGDFGDGKTAFTYILSRNLAKGFIKDPSTGCIPIRFALRDYHSAGSSKEFLRGRLDEFRADIASWRILKEQYNVLVILDGFDEMTKKLDSKTVTQNIRDLIECCEEFEGLKILITSRRHFFENQRNVKRLLQRLPSNRTCYLVPIDRRTTIKHLEEYAIKLGEEKKLKSICKLHDPIGLASKPLFLQMVKETLDELPEENLDEVILYETYIEKSLTRKRENLDDATLKVTPGEIHSNLIEILEKVALKLQASEENYVLLEEFVSTDKQNLAELLWKISESEEVVDELVEEKEKAVEDVTARVGVRSLLTRIKTDDTHKWPVDFCHRSMREYFVAKGICRALLENKERARKLLAELLLNHEILYFAAELMRQDNAREYESTLLSLIRSTRGTNQCRTLGGNAVTILYRLKGELPEDDWSGLNLDGADLSGANLSNKNFSGTSLRYANLDNVNFEGADFRNCDLTGVQIEETAPVLAVTTKHFGDQIIAAYGDNTIREWNVSQRLRNESKIIGRNTNGFINWIGTSPDSSLCALTNEEVIFYDSGDRGEFLERARFRMKSEYRQVIVKEDNLLLVSEKEHEVNRVLLIDLKQQKIQGLVEHEKVAFCENLDEKTFVLSEGKTSLRIVETTNSSLETAITLSAHETTSLCVFCCKKNSRYLLACGQRNGEILVWLIDFFKGKWKEKLLLKRHDHDDSISSLAFLDDCRIISGSIDRKMFIIKFGSDTGGAKGKKENELHLTAKCKGMKIEGVKRDRERRMLKNLISKAQ